MFEIFFLCWGFIGPQCCGKFSKKIPWEIEFDHSKKKFYFVRDREKYGHNLRGWLPYREPRYERLLEYYELDFWDEFLNIDAVITGQKYVTDVLRYTKKDRETAMPVFRQPYSVQERYEQDRQLVLHQFPVDLEARLIVITDCDLQRLQYKRWIADYQQSKKERPVDKTWKFFLSRLVINASKRFTYTPNYRLKFIETAVNSKLGDKVSSHHYCVLTQLISFHYLQLVHLERLPQELRKKRLQHIDVPSKLRAQFKPRK